MNKLHLFFSLFLLIFACTPKSTSPLEVEANLSELDQKVEALLSQMTLEEKVGQMNQYNGFWDFTGPSPEEGAAEQKYEDVKAGRVGSMLNVRTVDNVRALQKVAVEESRLGIPLLFAYDVIHGYKTLSPVPLAESASWDMEAIEQSARIAAIEASAAGINWTFAPMVDVSRDARWGRVMEGGGEDPYLGSQIAMARVKGFQGEDLSAPNTIAATIKHFAGYGFVEGGLEYNKADMDRLTLYNQVLPPFKAAVQQANARTVMSGFNELEGVPVTGSKFLLRDILKDQWGFDGVVISDWASIEELVSWGNVEDVKAAAKKTALAGCDVDMEAAAYHNYLVDLVESGKVPERVIDDAARRILRLKFELGIMDDPYKYCNEERENTLINLADHHEAVLDVAKKSIVLLKNDNNILPLKKEGLNIAVIGALANDKNSPLGGWRLASDDNSGVSLLEGLAEYEGNNISYAKGANVSIGKEAFIFEVEINETDKSGFAEAIETAKTADVVIMNLGEHGFQSGEARSRSYLDLPGVQQELLEAVYEVNPNIVLVLQNGRPLTIPWAAEHVPAIVEAWQLGSQSGHAIAQVLYGDYNPSGKLPMSFPRNVGQCPIYYGYKSTGRMKTKPQDDGLIFWAHYMDTERTPLYPFGYGLSYSTFEYSDISLSASEISMGQALTATVTVTNTSKVAGKEVVQLYTRDLVANVNRPIKELKGFEMVALAPGESKQVSFTIGEEELGYYNYEGEYVVESGKFDIFIGENSATERKQSFTLN